MWVSCLRRWEKEKLVSVHTFGEWGWGLDGDMNSLVEMECNRPSVGLFLGGRRRHTDDTIGENSLIQLINMQTTNCTEGVRGERDRQTDRQTDRDGYWRSRVFFLRRWKTI